MDSDPFCVRSLLLNFRVPTFFKGAISFPTLCLVDQEDLSCDILLCDVNFSHLVLKFFCLELLTHKVKLFLYSFQIQEKHRYGRVKTN